MAIASSEGYRASIVAKVRQLRQERRWTQAQLASLLGVSQSWLSDIERGKGSLSAEQFLLLLKTFNVTADCFSPARGESASHIQNALARLGAGHLVENSDLLPTERLREASDVLREVLVAAEWPRHIAALAPVLVSQIQYLNLSKLSAQFAELGYERRFGWLLENTLEAIRREEGEALPRERRVLYRRAATAIRAVLSLLNARAGQQRIPDDLLDTGGMSEESIDQIRQEASETSRRWGIVTRIGVEDFLQALRSARETR